MRDREAAKQVDDVALAPFPTYWTSNASDGDFHELVYMGVGESAVLNQILAESYLPRCTQDRPCPKVPSCARTHFGCPCVQPEGTCPPGLPLGYRVHRLIRVESARAWRRYARRRENICARRRDEELWRIEPPLLGEAAIRRRPHLFEPLQASVNEVYAWHGTSVRKALCIAREDYRLDLAGSGAGGMYGPGMYLAESCTKADEYARDDA
jgi:hypothetical protein